MGRRDKSGFLFGGLGILALMTLRRETNGVAWGEGWHFPVPDFIAPDGKRYAATITQELKPGAHGGVDIMYLRKGLEDRPEYPAGVLDVGGAKQATRYFAPTGTPILAARDGRVWSVGPSPTGISVVLDHGKPWATHYVHLATTRLMPHAKGLATATGKPTFVKAGEQIGTMGHNPNLDSRKGAVDAEKLRHLHFEPWYKGGDSRASVDPSAVAKFWGRSTWQT